MSGEQLTSIPSGADRRRPKKHWMLFFMRILLGAVFGFAAITKITSPYGLGSTIKAFQIVPADIAFTLAVFLIWHELICGIFMLLGLWTRAASIILIGLLTVFQFGLISVFVRGLDVDCGCFGAFWETKVGLFTISRNMMLLLFCILLLWQGSWKYSIDLIVKVNRRIKAGGPGWRRSNE